MKILIEKLQLFILMMLVSHGIGCICFPMIIEDLEVAVRVSFLVAFAAALIAVIVDYVKFMLRKDSSFRSDVLDDGFVEVKIKEIIKEPKKELTNEEL